MRDGSICPCPECRLGDIITLDNQLYTCTSCHKVWDIEELYKLLWIDRLQKLMERRMRVSGNGVSSLASVERRISHLQRKIQELELLLNDLNIMRDSVEDSSEETELVAFEMHLEKVRHNLVVSQKNLVRMMQLRDELSANE